MSLYHVNLIPSSMVSKDRVATEPAVFELACVINNIKHIVICGHSDCKAVNMLYDIHTDHADVEPTTFSPLRAWVRVVTKIFVGFGEVLFNEIIIGHQPVSTVKGRLQKNKQ